MNNDSHLLYEAYMKKTCLEYVNPDAAETVRQAREERQREAARKRDYSGSSSRGSYGPQGDYPSSRSAHYADDEDAESAAYTLWYKDPEQKKTLKWYSAKSLEELVKKVNKGNTGEDYDLPVVDEDRVFNSVKELLDYCSHSDFFIKGPDGKLASGYQVKPGDWDEDSEWDDEERRGDANGRWSDKRTGGSHRDDQGSDEDAETWGVEGKLKAALHEVESVGYGGDHVDPMEIAKLVLGHQGDWGDEYNALLKSLTHVVGAYYEKGIQDS
jgi:hypothetical protein